MRFHKVRLLAGPFLVLAVLTACGDEESGPGKHHLVFTGVPTATDWGVAFATQPVITIVDDDDLTVDTATATVTLTLVDGAGAQLTDTTSVAAVAGVATFAGLSIDRPATNVRLVASAPGLRSDTSDVFTIGGPLADRVVFTVVPDSGRGGEYLGVVPTAEVRTADGKLVPWYDGVATVWIAGSVSEPARAWTNLDGKLVDTTEGGIVTFQALNIDTAKAGYRLVVEIPGLLPDTSPAFDVLVGLMSATKSSWAIFGDPVTVGDSVEIYLNPRDLGGNRVPLIPDSLMMHRVSGTSDGTFSAWEDMGAGTGLAGPFRVFFHATFAGTPVKYMVSHRLIPGATMPGAITVNP